VAALFAVTAFAALAAPCFAIDSSSRYVQLSSDVLVTTSSQQQPQVVVQTSVTLATDQDVFFESDGRFFPNSQNGLAVMEIRLDGGLVSDGSALDYKDYADPQQHSYNCIGATHVPAGTHTVQLVAYNHPSVSGGQFYVGAGSNLSVVVDPAVSTSHAWLNTDSAIVNVATDGVDPPTAVPYRAVVSTSHLVYADPVVVLTSGRALAGNSPTYGGDAMFGSYLNGVCPSTAEQAWTVNDLTPSAESHAPLYGHALYPSASGTVTATLAATELPYGLQQTENPVRYVVGSQSTVIAMSGGMPIYGGVVQGGSTAICSPNTYQGAPVGGNNFWSAPLTVQAGESGNVFFTVKTRILDCNPNEGPGTVVLQLVLDGAGVGSVGVQQYDFNNTCHQRTLTASYLALGMSQGPHSVSAVVSNSGLTNLAIGGDMGLLFFGS
jgi:hypothetical protein